jgi:hypothetical protein
VLVALSACTSRPEAPAPIPATVKEPMEPRVIELSEAKATLLEPTLVAVEVRYRFTQGQPSQCYAWEITFPGTSNHGVRRMDSWELKTEGVIRDKITLSKAGVNSFAMYMAEAPSRREMYRKISNVLEGPIE